jgi:hypothetical protein
MKGKAIPFGKIQSKVIQKVARQLISTRSNKYGNKPISKEKFKDLMEHAPVAFGQKVRFEKHLTAHETKKFLGEFIKHIQEHPEYKLSSSARSSLNVKIHQGDHIIQDFNEKRVGLKGLKYVMKEQAASAGAAGPTPEQILHEQRRKEAIKNLNIRTSAEQRDLQAKQLPNVGLANARNDKDVQTSAFGETQTAGKNIAGLGSAAPDKNSAPLAQSHPVQLGGGIGTHRLQPPGNIEPIPSFGVSTKVSSQRSAPTEPAGEEEITTGKTEEDDKLPHTPSAPKEPEDIDTNLPLAA